VMDSTKSSPRGMRKLHIRPMFDLQTWQIEVERDSIESMRDSDARKN
jgi:hypothetical protein